MAVQMTGTLRVMSFTKSGKMDVKLVIKYNNCTDSITKKEIVEIYPTPEPSFTVSDSNSCDTPFFVQFSNTTPNVESLEWEFGDSDTSTQKSIVHKYSKHGNYTVKLKVIDKKGV